MQTGNLNDIYYAICALDSCNHALESESVHGSNSPNYEICKRNKLIVERARQAYERLVK